MGTDRPVRVVLLEGAGIYRAEVLIGGLWIPCGSSDGLFGAIQAAEKARPEPSDVVWSIE